MLRRAVVMACLIAAVPALGQSQRSNGLDGLSERIQRDYDEAMARSRNREIVTSPLPSRDYGRSYREAERVRRNEYDLNDRIIRLENEAAERRLRGY
jgi:hypothetical protein